MEKDEKRMKSVNITAIVTLFYSNKDNWDNLKNIAKQVNRVIVVDNTPEKQGFSNNEISNLTYIAMGYNAGQPAAFNSVLKNNDFSWQADDYIIFFDQDTKIEDGYIHKLLSIYYKINKSKKYRLGCLGPVFYNTSSGIKEMQHIKKPIAKGCYIVEDVIESSLLTQYKILKEVDFWNEEFFLDGDDWDLCWRIKDKGYQIIKTDLVSITHSIGESERRFLCFRIRRSAPVRLYYRTREVLNLLTKSYTSKRMKLNMIFDLTFINMMRVLFLDEKKKRWMFIKRGWIDHKKGITGEYKEV